jgi:hypothetical protein
MDDDAGLAREGMLVVHLWEGDPMPMRTPSTVRRVGAMALSVGASCVIAAAMLAGPADAGRHSSGVDRTHVSKATMLMAHLTGAKEVPGPGDPNGRGTAMIMLKPGVAKVCAQVSWTRIGRPIAAHIHKGGPAVSGPVVVDLTGSVTGGANCVHAGVTKIKKIKRHPGRYYFNIHTNAFQAGAIRGQLHAGHHH